MPKSFDTLATALLLGCALVVTGLTVHREFAARDAKTAVVGHSSAPTFVTEWQKFSPAGRWIGDSTARVKIIEFADFECPFCKRFHEKFKVARDSLGKDVALLLVQFPLEMHRFAQPAALAAECAAQQGQWESFQNDLFDKQDSLGLKSWISFARDAGVADTIAFSNCVLTNKHSVNVDAGLAAGKSINLTGTPTVIINGWRYASPPYDSILSIAKRRLAESH